MSRQKKKDDDDKGLESGPGGALLGGAAVVGIAALAYGAWKLYDFFSDSASSDAVERATSSSSSETKLAKKTPDSSDEDDETERTTRRRVVSSGENRSEESSSPVYASSDAAPSDVDVSLSDRLMQYYWQYVEVSPAAVKDAERVVRDVKAKVSQRLRQDAALDALNVGDFEEIGGSADGLVVVRPDRFDFLIPFRPSPETFAIERDENSGRPGIEIMLRRADWAWADVCDDTKRLRPEKLMKAVDVAVTSSAPSTSSSELYPVSFAQRPTVARIDCGYDDGRKTVMANFVAGVTIDGRSFVPVDDGLWRESFHRRESLVLDRFGPAVDAHRIVLKIFTAIGLNFPLQFGILGSRHFKAVLFRVMDDQPDAADWEPSAISERVIDFLIELGSCLKERSLPDPFQPGVNLLDEISVEASQNLAHFVNKIVGQHNFVGLLKMDYGRK